MDDINRNVEEISTTLKELQRRVDFIDKVFWVVGAVAVVFGISGAYGLNILTSVRAELKNIDTTAATAMDKARQAAVEKFREDVSGETALITKVVPAGVVAAFDLERCPDGWAEFREGRGRVLIGVGTGAGLTPRSARETGGVERVTLTLSELPSHAHRTVEAGDGGNSRWGVGGNMNARHGVRWDPNFPTSNTESVGLGQAHENMPPFIVMLFCRKK